MHAPPARASFLTPVLFSDAARGWKMLGALLLLYAGCAYNHLDQARELPLWGCESHPAEADGLPFWLQAERIVSMDPVACTLTVEPKGYRVLVHVPPEAMTDGMRPGNRLYARLRFDRERGFLMEPGARTASPKRIAHLELYLVSIPALLWVAVVFLRQFRVSFQGILTPREPPRA